jgi:uncharacterized protein (TIGR02145 family)
MIEPAGTDQIFVNKLSEIILANLGDEDFGVKELIRESGASRDTLSRRLYSATGKTINQFIRETRLHKAMEMLQNEDLSVSEVAHKVGFSSLNYFNKCFYGFFGYSAGKVKKSGSENNQEIKPVQVIARQEQKKHAWRILMIIASGILSVAIILYLVFNVFIKNSTFYPRAVIKNIGKSFFSKKDNNNTVKDIDGNIYRTVTIGTQVWMAEDLKTTRYNDGTPIPNITDDTEWTNLQTGAYCWPNNDESNKTIYGALYNWYATGGKLCPVGWHISTDKDWETLVDFCGGWEIAGGKLKEAGTAHWDSTNVESTNESGFTALPAGVRPRDGRFRFLKGNYVGYWCPPRCGDIRTFTTSRTWIYLTETVPNEGYCVRCVKDK